MEGGDFLVCDLAESGCGYSSKFKGHSLEAIN